MYALMAKRTGPEDPPVMGAVERHEVVAEQEIVTLDVERHVFEQKGWAKRAGVHD